jgi:hypothetical protein
VSRTVVPDTKTAGVSKPRKCFVLTAHHNTKQSCVIALERGRVLQDGWRWSESAVSAGDNAAAANWRKQARTCCRLRPCTVLAMTISATHAAMLGMCELGGITRCAQPLVPRAHGPQRLVNA